MEDQSKPGVVILHKSMKCEESIQQVLINLCHHQLELYTNHKKALVTRQKYSSDQFAKLKRSMYYHLFVGLQSPYVLPSCGDHMACDEPFSFSNDIYSKLAEYIFNIRMEYGQVMGTDRLEQCGDILKNYNNEVVDDMLKVILKLSKHYSAPSEYMFQKSRKDDFSQYFQFDQKAIVLGDALRSSSNWNDEFQVSSSSIFSLPPGSFFKGDVPSWMNKIGKESQHSLDSRLTLFGGLTSSTVTSLDAQLALPELPSDPCHIPFACPERKLNKSSIDEGFHELSDFSSLSERNVSSETKVQTISVWDKLSIWDDAVALGKLNVSKWEKRNSVDERLDNLYFCQLGKQGFDCMYHVRLLEVTRITGEPLQLLHITEEQMYRDTLYALIGVPSTTYIFYPHSCMMKPALNVQCPGISMETLYEFMCRFAQVGTHYRQLSKFCQHHSDKPHSKLSGGLILNAFIGALKEILHSYRSAYFIILDKKDISMMELWRLFEMFAKQLKFLADICLCSVAFSKKKEENIPKPKFPVGANLLSYIYSMAVKNSSTEQYSVLLFIFKCISVPYIRFLTDWLLEGVSNDPYNEFFVRTDPQYLRSRDKHFWTQGFQMKQKKGSIPLFLDELAENIFACGKAINLLKLIDIKHFLFQGSVRPPPIDVTYSWRKFDSIEEQCKEYIRQINKCEMKEREKREKEKLISQNILKEKLRKGKMAVEKEIKRIDELEEKVKFAIKFKKKEEFEQLKKQFETAISGKKEKRMKLLEEDNLWIEEMKMEAGKKDAIKEKAREELILFYENLSRKADQREEHARWIIQRHELYEKRKAFLKNEYEKFTNEYNGLTNPTNSSYNKDHECIDSVTPVNNSFTEHANSPINLRYEDSRVSANILENSADKQLNFVSVDHADGPVEERKNERSNDQSLSMAKALLYPIEKGDGPANIGHTTLLAKGSAEMTDNEENSARIAIYPSVQSNVPADIKNVDVEGTKDVMCVGETNENESLDVLSVPDVCDETIEKVSRLLIYPKIDNEGHTSIDVTSSNRNIRNDGTKTKTLLYPQNVPITMDDISINIDEAIAKNVEGQETKSLLYPTVLPPKPISSNNVNINKDETKRLLYPELSSDQKIDSTNIRKMERVDAKSSIIFGATTLPTGSSRGLFQEEGINTKAILYPDGIDGEMRIGHGNIADEIEMPSSRSESKVDEGKEMKDMLYPDVTVHSSEPHIIKEFENPSSVQTIIYPNADCSQKSNEKHDIKEFERPSTMQIIMNENLVESEKSIEKHQSKDFERPSIMQSILYPGSGSEMIPKKVLYREFEPPTRIKSLLYPQNEEQGTVAPLDTKGLTHEEIWMDYVPEPYMDNYDILNKDPQTSSFGNVVTAISYIYNADEDADVVKRLPLETVIKRCLTIPIQAQISLVNSAVVKYFLNDLKIESHFDAFRKFLLLEDGEFGHSLCHSLFEKIALGMKPQKFCQSMLFTNIIPEALNMSLYASKIDYSRQLKFSLKWMPEVFHPSDVAALDFLELRYRVPWPCNIVITENSITKYNKVFSFLLRLKKASWSLQNVWLNLKKAGFDRKAAVSPQLRQLHLFRHEMQHFVNNLERYIVNQIIHVSWQEFQEDLRHHVQSLDSLHKCHVHYLDKIIFRSLLSKNATPVYNLINEMFGIIAKFESRLLSQSWEAEKESGFVQHPLFGMLKEGHRAFKCGAGFLFSVIQNLVKRGYQDHLDDLLLQVNFNTYYNATAKT